MALLRDGDEVTCEDIQAVAVRSLQHRIILNFEGVASGIAPKDILANVLDVTAEEPACIEISG
jgi:MoxR-like ATPase